MREQLESIITELQEVLMDVDKVEAGAYGFKSAAPDSRKEERARRKVNFRLDKPR